jgi:type IV pilus assembly protein PilQ
MRISFRESAFAIAAVVLFVAAAGTGAFAAKEQTISEVEVRSDGDRTRIVLRGAEDPIYTAFMRENPARLIIDLPDVAFEGVQTPIEVNNAHVTDITLGAFGDPRIAATMSRVSVGLTEEARYEVIPNGRELIVEVRASTDGAPAAPAPAAAMADQAADAESEMPAAAEEPASAEPAEAAPEPTPAAEAAAEPAVSRVTRIVWGDGALSVEADGPIDNVDSFELDDPERIVIDLWGAENAVWPARFSLDEGAVAAVRVGAHPDKVRVVLDLREPVSSHAIETTADGLSVRLEVADAMADASEEAPPAAADEAAEDAEEVEDDEPYVDEEAVDLPENGEEEAAMAPPPADGDVWVESVHFESLPGIDRVVMTLNGGVEARLVEPDPKTIIVDVPGARIDPDKERRVDTREFGGPIEVFSAFKTPEVVGEQVRLVVKRRGVAKATLSWVGNQLRLEVPKPAGMEPAGAPMPPQPVTPPAAIEPGTGTSAATIEMPAPGAETPVGVPVTPASIADPFGMEDSLPAAPAAIDILEEGGFSREKEYQGRRISLDFRDADIGNILRLIAEVSDLNVIAGEEVGGKVTIRLVDVPWDQALDVILLTKGLGFVRIGNILRIAPIGILNKEEQARLQERRAKEKLEDLVVKLQPVNYAAVGEVQGLVKRLLSGRGTVNVDKRTSTLIIKDIPSVIHEATALVKAIDTQTPQVLIEAKIVEASLDFARSLGVRWGVGYNANGGVGGAEDFRLGDGSNSVVPGFGAGSQATNFVVGLPVASSLGTLTMGLLGLDDRIQLDLQLQAAESTSKGKVISSPRVVTLDNRQAKIQQGVAIRFDASDGDSVSTSFVDAVLELSVTPHITSDRSIIMKIKVSRNAPQLNSTGSEVVGIAKNETSTEALVKDGQTMVLGGIYTVDKGRGSSRIPFLADLPLIGSAFRNSTAQDVRRELLIFVTPRVVQGLAPAS